MKAFLWIGLPGMWILNLQIDCMKDGSITKVATCAGASPVDGRGCDCFLRYSALGLSVTVQTPSLRSVARAALYFVCVCVCVLSYA